MKFFEVELFIMGIAPSPSTTRKVSIEARNQDEAEELAHDWYIADGWGVLGSREISEEEAELL